MNTRAGRHAVVVGVNGSGAAMNAVRWAAYLAWRLHESLTVVHVAPLIGEHAAVASSRGSRDFAPERFELARMVVDQAVALVRTCVSDLDVHTEVYCGSADSVLVELSGRARFVVVGAQEVVGTALIGPTTMRVVTHAHCPVAVWRGSAGRPVPRLRPVVVAVDGTPVSEPAIRCAFELASACGALLSAVHVYPPGLDPIGRSGSGKAEARSLLSALLAGWREKYADVRVSETAVPGNAVTVLTELSGTAQLLVVGSRGRGSAAAAVLGSTSRDLLHRAACPVLVCREEHR
ncbi:universal stress protein [Nocardia pseudobrasiliensis]|uniref:Nucleotide-binding universal stress UspA family protein n=1 Tax=Nocardia pseudobrasiliensis TaxID=45979 RepID=A0A370IC50_9NOCA|nr:universal stress protein [Nocardia pseudobrasiliensis]RDI68308.1 nucleotide-binding universal stress UspA family protein [Nocardia pseudobrasiliensis]